MKFILPILVAALLRPSMPIVTRHRPVKSSKPSPPAAWRPVKKAASLSGITGAARGTRLAGTSK